MTKRTGSLVYATGVYQILHVASGKRYVGSAAVNLGRRWIDHRGALRSGRHRNSHLQSAWSKYGEDAFNFEVLELCEPENCIAREQYWLDLHRSADRQFGYNKAEKAGSVLGLRHSDETKAVLKVKAQIQFSDPEARKRVSDRCKGVKLSPERVEALRISSTGRTHSQETREKMRESQKTQVGRKSSPEQRAKLRAAWVKRKLAGPSAKVLAGRLSASAKLKGRVFTDEEKAKVSQGLKGRVLSQETRDKLSKINTGKKASEATRIKMSQSHKARHGH